MHAAMSTTVRNHRLIILYGMGGLSDVGRHAVQVAVDLRQREHDDSKPAAPSSLSSSEKVVQIVVLTKFPDLLLQENWNCGCPEPHHIDVSQLAAASIPPAVDVVKVTDWTDPSLQSYFATPPSTASTTPVLTTVISCLGNRQTFGPNDASEAVGHLILPAMRKHRIERLVCITSVGVEEDWPPVEFFAAGRLLLSCLFMTASRHAFRDLTKMERHVRAASLSDDGDDNSIDYLLVRPVGIGEDVKPVGKWQLQKQKHRDKLGFNMAKLDVARFMVKQALTPSLHMAAVVIGAVVDEATAQTWE
jgi:NAD(P)H-binding